jgi:signal transduction histidine kinase
MAVDKEAFEKAQHPTDLLSLLDENVLQHLVNGFSYKIGSGVTILYRTGSADPTGRFELTRLDPLGDPTLARQFFHPFCRDYRNDPDHEQRCQECDETSARRYFSGEWNEPILYRCHNQLWEMAYPMRISNTVLAVLIAGQLIVTADENETKEKLEVYRIPVDWRSVQNPGFPQVDAILDKFPEERRQSLEQILLDDRANRSVGLSGLLARWKHFIEFGKMMEMLLAKFHALILERAEESLLLDMSAELTARSATESDYWEEIGNVSRLVLESVGMGPVDVYSRSGSRFFLRVSRGVVIQKQSAKRLPVHLTLDLPLDDLREIRELDISPELTNLIGAEPGALLYKCEFPNVNERSLSTILVIHAPGAGRSSDDFALKFCHVIAQRSDVSGLLFEIMEDRQAFSNRVRRSSHASKTPLQAALAAVENLERFGLKATVDDFHKALPGIRKNIMRASIEITELLARSSEPRKTVDLRTIVESLIEELSPIAQKVEVGLVYERPMEPVPVEICGPDMRIALRNLLDNAIKYSYRRKDVRLSLSVVRSRSAKFVISNYGIGIPDERLCEIREIGVRGNVPDEKAEKAGRTRTGSGVGLPMAITDIEAHGGSLHITSQPADPGLREPSHRFVTIVTVTLPITNEER